ncbi:MAG: hypothetical protein M9927_04260 [Anaerolineae bacterium]|nr:hypothetical protein [Anaerolineae bacterium]
MVVSNQGTEEERYPITVVGISDGRQYSLQPSVFVPLLTWDKIRPQAGSSQSSGEPWSPGVIVVARKPSDVELMKVRLPANVSGVEVADRRTAYESTPGYSAQQSTLNTQRYFTLLIGVLVIGGFFQIQTLQKIAQIGMLKAIGTTNGIVALAAVTQIVAVNTIGVVRRRRVAAAFADLPGRGTDRVHFAGGDPRGTIPVDHRAVGRAGVRLGAD